MALVDEFMAAVKANDASKVTEFLDQDLSLVTAKSGDNSATLTAVYYGAKDVIDVLLQHGATLGYFEAVAVGQTHKVLDFLNDQPTLLNDYSHDGFTALGLAAFFGHRNIVLELVARGAQVNAISQNSMKVMALHSAVAHRHTEIADILLANGADVNAKQQDGFTPLLEAVHNSQLDMIELLLQRGANVTLAKDDGQTPLAIAQEEGNGEVIDLLIKNGAER